MCYDYQNGIIDEKEDIIFAIEPKLFSIRTINLPNIIKPMKSTNVEVMDVSLKTSNLQLKSRVHITKLKIIGNKYEPK
jgi:hypothetical protein